VSNMKNKFDRMWDRIKGKGKANKTGNGFFTALNNKVILDSVTRLNPTYLAKFNPVMFTVEIGFFLVLLIGFIPNISKEFVNQNQIFYFETATIFDSNCLVCDLFRVSI
jgi:potassium-transporting ATPase ATP-binding subunit